MVELLDKDLVAKRFKSCAATYEENATVQREISTQLFNLLQRFEQIDYSRVLEIGCCTGLLTRMVSSGQNIQQLWLNDIVTDFCSMTEVRVGDNVSDIRLLPGDIEVAKLPKDLTLVLSSSTLQWITDLSLLSKKIMKSLEPGGHLAFSLFGPGTMEEITALTGRGLPYLSEQGLLSSLDKNMAVIHTHRERKRIYFPTARAVLRHIQRTGVGGLGNYNWSVAKLREFERCYMSRFGTELGVPVSYISTFVVAEKC